MSQFTNELFLEKTLKFENRNINAELIPIPITDAKFGILNLKAVSSPLSQEDFEFIFMVDCSGSMSDKCSDGRSKMQHIVHTLKNMILYFKENSIKINITVDSFDDNIYNIIKRCTITEDNYASIIEKIDRISPRQSTDIELALKSVKKTVKKIKTDFPEHNIVSIFMTDGEATSGNTNHNYLSELVDRTVTNAFIGFGIDHDATLLNAVSNGEKSAYYFIDKLENSGLVYGEILHGVVYKLLTDVEITVVNGLIYDFKNNTWNQTLKVGEFVSEANKTYHIISSTPESCVVSLTAKKTIEDIQFHISQESTSEDLTKYIYRQRTLQHLYIVGDFLKRKNQSTNLNIPSFNRFYMFDNDCSQPMREEQKTITENLRKFIEEMKKYMTDNNIEDDKFMKNLCDDIYISYRTFGTRFAAMYNNARQTSQGTQRCYTVSHTPQDDVTQNLYGNQSNTISLARTLSIPKLRRNQNVGVNMTDETVNLFENVIELNHVVSDFADTPYLTPGSTQIMREISSTRAVMSEDEEEKEDIL
jgi:AraC-like DNA-binding protein